MQSPSMASCMSPMCKCGMYVQSNDTRGRILSTAGSSGNVERCYSSVTGEACAVKKIPQKTCEELEHLVQNETDAYQVTGACAVPRIVRLKDTFVSSGSEACLVLELVDGCELSRWPEMLAGPLSAAKNEAWVKQIAVQLLDTLEGLHLDAQYAHLDITSNNIMLRNAQPNRWDQIRLLDLGLAQPCVADGKEKKVYAQGCTPLYASPQQLYAQQLLLECAWTDGASSEAGSNNSTALGRQQSTDAPAKGNKMMQRLASLLKRAVCCGKGGHAVDEEESGEEEKLMVDGPKADVYSAGVVLYEMLTGVLPLEPSPTDARPVAPDWVPEEHKESWEEYEAILQLHYAWAREFKVLSEAEGKWNVKHPVLDRVRKCSAEPELAAEFFAMVLYPGINRVTALEAQHATYLKSLKMELKEHNRRNHVKPCPCRPPQPIRWSFQMKDGANPCAFDDVGTLPPHSAGSGASTQPGPQFRSADLVHHAAAATHCPAKHMRFSSDTAVRTPALQPAHVMLAGPGGPDPTDASLQPPYCPIALQPSVADHSRSIAAHPGGDATATTQLRTVDSTVLQQKVPVVSRLQQPGSASQLQDSGSTAQLQLSGVTAQLPSSGTTAQLQSSYYSAQLQSSGSTAQLRFSDGAVHMQQNVRPTQVQISAVALKEPLQRHPVSSSAEPVLSQQADGRGPKCRPTAEQHAPRGKTEQAKRARQALGKACRKVKVTTKSCATCLKTLFTLPACCKGSATLD